jgi:hypothetical protein
LRRVRKFQGKLEEFYKIRRKKKERKPLKVLSWQQIGGIELKRNKFLKKEHIYNISYINILFLE